MSRRKSIYWLNACELELETYHVDAQEGQDYTSVVKILEFEPQTTVKNVTISIIYDKVSEVDEDFVLYLSSGAGAFLSPFAQAEVTIINSDGRCNLY